MRGDDVRRAGRDAAVQKGFSAMNFCIMAARGLSRTPLFSLLAATALTITVIVPRAQAQAPAPAPAAPKAAPKAAAPKAAPKAAPAPAPSAPAPAGAPSASAPPADQQIQLSYSPWTKVCVKGQDANTKQVCF